MQCARRKSYEMTKCLTLMHLTACWITESPNGPGNLQGAVARRLQVLFMLSVYCRAGSHDNVARLHSRRCVNRAFLRISAQRQPTPIPSQRLMV